MNLGRPRPLLSRLHVDLFMSALLRTRACAPAEAADASEQVVVVAASGAEKTGGTCCRARCLALCRWRALVYTTIQRLRHALRAVSPTRRGLRARCHGHSGAWTSSVALVRACVSACATLDLRRRLRRRACRATGGDALRTASRRIRRAPCTTPGKRIQGARAPQSTSTRQVLAIALKPRARSRSQHAHAFGVSTPAPESSVATRARSEHTELRTLHAGASAACAVPAEKA